MDIENPIPAEVLIQSECDSHTEKILSSKRTWFTSKLEECRPVKRDVLNSGASFGHSLRHVWLPLAYLRKYRHARYLVIFVITQQKKCFCGRRNALFCIHTFFMAGASLGLCKWCNCTTRFWDLLNCTSWYTGSPHLSRFLGGKERSVLCKIRCVHCSWKSFSKSTFC